jgi:magnesium-transporting ATPase (P-type)
VIVDAIGESRRIFRRMNSYAIYRIGGIIRVLLFITLSILIFNFYPVTAVMIVLMTLLTICPSSPSPTTTRATRTNRKVEHAGNPQHCHLPRADGRVLFLQPFPGGAENA